MNCSLIKSVTAISLFLMPLCLYAQPGTGSMEIQAETFRLNKSPVKANDFYEYYLVPVEVNSKKGFVNALTGDTLVAVKYDSVSYFTEGLAAVQLQGKWGFVNRYGKEMVPCRYDSTSGEFNNGICLVQRNKKTGYINKACKEIIPCEFDEVSSAGNNLLWVMKNEKYGLYNINGKQLSAPVLMVYKTLLKKGPGLKSEISGALSIRKV
ncbi:MAG: WG repeat-containing protein [Chitinophagaceae bacterium]|nr:WG repeat-containing protein [Chitinophagaceae bacterium]